MAGARHSISHPFEINLQHKFHKNLVKFSISIFSLCECRGPFHARFLHRNTNLMETPFFTHLSCRKFSAMKYCSWHHRWAVVAWDYMIADNYHGKIIRETGPRQDEYCVTPWKDSAIKLTKRVNGMSGYFSLIKTCNGLVIVLIILVVCTKICLSLVECIVWYYWSTKRT